MKQLDENKLRESLQKAPWDGAFVFENIDDVVNAWVDMFTQVVNDHVPFKQKRISRPAQPRWLTNCMLMKMKERDYFLSKAKKSMNDHDWRQHRMARNQVVKMIVKANLKEIISKHLLLKAVVILKQFDRDQVQDLQNKLYKEKC